MDMKEDEHASTNSQNPFLSHSWILRVAVYIGCFFLSCVSLIFLVAYGSMHHASLVVAYLFFFVIGPVTSFSLPVLFLREASLPLRNAARHGWFGPYLFPLFMAITQFFHAMAEATIIMVDVLLVFLAGRLGEWFLARRAQGRLSS